MGYGISYSVRSNIGRVRQKNQDNFLCDGRFLDLDNEGLDDPLTGVIRNEAVSVFAVFDGMGGGNHGEAAAHCAAKRFNAARASINEKNIGTVLSEICLEANDEVCSLTEEYRSSQIGTTVVTAAFTGKMVYICSVGDSKAFIFRKKNIEQLTIDHVDTFVKDKTTLTQYLGVPRDDFIIEPYTDSRKIKRGDRLILCSDGLTDMVSQAGIKRLLSLYKNTEKCAEALMDEALHNGGRDNITFILLDIQ
jgi:protein phosphatase